MQAGSTTWPRLTRLLVLALVPCTALVYVPQLASPFFAPKTAVFVLVVAAILCLAMIDPISGSVSFRGSSKAFLYSVCGLLLLMIASAALSSWRYMTTPSIVWICTGPILWLVSIRALRQDRLLLLKVAAISGALVCSIALLQIAAGRDFLFPLFGRSTQLIAGRMQFFSTLGNPNFVATYAAACLAFAIILILSKASKRLGTLTAVPMIATTLLSGSRAGLLAAVVGVLVASFLVTTTRRVRVLITVAAVLIGGLGFSLTRNYRSLSESLHGRVVIWRATLDGHWLSPTGTGPGTFAYAYPVRLGKFIAAHPEEQRYAEREDHAQNDLVELWSELGFLGAVTGIVLLGAAVKPFKAALLADRQATAGAAACVVAILTASLFDFPLHRPETWVLFWLALAVPFSVNDSHSAPIRFPALIRIPLATVVLAAGLWFSSWSLLGSWYTQRGFDLEAQHYPATAHSQFERALRYDLTQADARFGRARVLLSMKMFPEAWKASTEALDWIQEPEMWLLRSRIARAMGDDQLALSQLQIGIAAFPYSEELQREVAEVHSPDSR